MVEEAAAELEIAILPDELPEQRIFYRSDHYSFAKKGVPAIYPSFGLTKEGFTEFQSYYHRPNDDPALALNYNYMRRHVQLLFLTGLWAANAEERPTWTAGDEFERADSSAGN